MRINVNENTILKAVGESHPLKSSFAKLVKETGMARNEVTEVVDGLKKIGYVNVTPANEIYLKADGRKYLGIDTVNSEVKYSSSVQKEAAPISLAKDCNVLSKDLEPKALVNGEEKSLTPKRSVLSSIDELAMKLNKPAIEIADRDLKGQALAKLADLMSDDIAELLLDIKSDLERAAA
jgi:biotin operon repressor